VPWKEIRPVDERIRFIAAVEEDPRGNFAQLCRRFGIHRSKGYKWLERYRRDGPGGLSDRKPVARTCPHRTPDEVVDRIVAVRKEHPYDGPRKLRVRLLKREPELQLPAASTIGEILDRYGLIRPRRARLRVPPHPSPLEPCQEPNDVWCVDFKGHFGLGDGDRCYPLTLTDGASRYLIKCEALAVPSEAPVRKHFELAFREFGLPTRIRSDNGAPFATKAIGAPPYATLADQQRAFDRFRHDYNQERPHEALGQTPPSAHYEPSLRTMPDSPQLRPLAHWLLAGPRRQASDRAAALNARSASSLRRSMTPSRRTASDLGRTLHQGHPTARGGPGGLAPHTSRSLSPKDPVCGHEERRL
jgi:transposase InsO family protein